MKTHFNVIWNVTFFALVCVLTKAVGKDILMLAATWLIGYILAQIIWRKK